jgi:MFS superfamily sulfate permease-like transporter
MINSINDFLEANLFIAIAMINAVLIYNKYVLKSDGHRIYWVWGWWRDCQIIKTTPKYKTLKCILYASFFYLMGVLVLGILINAFK